LYLGFFRGVRSDLGQDKALHTGSLGRPESDGAKREVYIIIIVVSLHNIAVPLNNNIVSKIEQLYPTLKSVVQFILIFFPFLT